MFKIFDPFLECIFDLDFSCKIVSKLKYKSLAFVAGFNRATDEGSLPEIAQYSPYFLPLNVFTAFKGSNLYFIYLSGIIKPMNSGSQVLSFRGLIVNLVFPTSVFGVGIFF